MNRLLLTILLASASGAQAVTATRLEVPVTYHPNAGVVESVKNECQIEEMLKTRVGRVLGKLNGTGNGTLDTGSDPAGDNVLRLRITHVLGVGGGAWSGPKAITLTAELLEGDKVLRQTKINRWSVGGVFGAFKGTCSILERSAEAISKDLNRWIRNPKYKIVEEPAPKEAEEQAPSAEAAPTLPVSPETPIAQVVEKPQTIEQPIEQKMEN